MGLFFLVQLGLDGMLYGDHAMAVQPWNKLMIHLVRCEEHRILLGAHTGVYYSLHLVFMHCVIAQAHVGMHILHCVRILHNQLH